MNVIGLMDSTVYVLSFNESHSNHKWRIHKVYSKLGLIPVNIIDNEYDLHMGEDVLSKEK